MIRIRRATRSDAPALGSIVSDYMRELFRRDWGGSVSALERDLDIDLRVFVAEDEGLVGFAAFRDAYDLHHCAKGGYLLDLYVRPAWRGHGVSLRLIASVCAAVTSAGGRFLQGQSVADAATQARYEQVAVVFPGAECIVGGRAFRTLAGLAGQSARQIVRALPEREWNFED